MQRFTLTAAVAALLCVGASVAIHAETNPEIATPTSDIFVFHDGNTTITSSFAELGYAVVDGHAITEGDIVLGPVSSNGTLQRYNPRGLGQTRLFDRWNNGIIPYQFSAELSDTERELAQAAVAHWNEFSSLSLVDITPETLPSGESNSGSQTEYENYLTFESSNSCRSYVGMIGGNQPLWISESCGVGSIIHEIGHAVGLFHEHTRNDRDNYINVIEANINSTFAINFEILTAGTTLLGEYDYNSIMHYGNSFFSQNGQNTIEVLGDAEIGQRIALSDGDIQSVNTMYETDLSLVVDANLVQAGTQVSADIQITNQGQVGSNQLRLELDAGGNATWLSVSPDSGWECSADGTKLNCSRDSLESSATSLFTVTATGTAASELSAELTAKTRETSYDNNGFNATVLAPPILSAQTTDTDAPAENEQTIASNQDTVQPNPQPNPVSEPVTEQQALPVTDNSATDPLVPDEEAPELQAATPEQTFPEATPAQTSPEASSEGSDKIDFTTEESSSGGALSPLSALSILLGIAAIRRRRNLG